jgi:hypothetical protein
MCDEAKNLGSKRRINAFTKRHSMKGNGTEGKTPQKGKSLNNFKVRVSNPKEISSRRGLLLKPTNLKGMLVGSPKVCFSLAMKWGIIP